MNELYWIERLDAVNVTFVIILIVALVWLVYVFIESNVESYSEKECIDKGIYKAKKVSYVIIAISLLILIFTPTTKEMYRIIGIGETINYLRQNEASKELTDKCIKALALFLDKNTGDNKEKNSNNTTR